MKINTIAKLKAVSQEEKLLKNKKQFKNLLKKPSKISDKPIQKLLISK